MTFDIENPLLLTHKLKSYLLARRKGSEIIYVTLGRFELPPFNLTCR